MRALDGASGVANQAIGTAKQGIPLCYAANKNLRYPRF
jgi:hypothetical protein